MSWGIARTADNGRKVWLARPTSRLWSEELSWTEIAIDAFQFASHIDVEAFALFVLPAQCFSVRLPRDWQTEQIGTAAQRVVTNAAEARLAVLEDVVDELEARIETVEALLVKTGAAIRPTTHIATPPPPVVDPKQPVCAIVPDELNGGREPIFSLHLDPLIPDAIQYDWTRRR